MAAFEAWYDVLRGSQRDALAAATVVWGTPGEDQPDRLVVVGRVMPASQDPAALGQGRREERYRIETVVDVAMQAFDHAEVNREARRIVQDVEGEAHDHPRLEGALHGDGWAGVDEIEVAAPQQLETGAFQTVVFVRLGCTARI